MTPKLYASARRASWHSPLRISGAVNGRVPGWICSIFRLLVIPGASGYTRPLVFERVKNANGSAGASCGEASIESAATDRPKSITLRVSVRVTYIFNNDKSP